MNQHKVILSSNTVYKEIELLPAAQRVKVGTGIECDVRLHKDLFFGQIELTFLKQNDQWSVLCSDNLYLTSGGVIKLITKKLEHGDTLEIRYQDSNNLVFTMDFLIDFDDGKTEYSRKINLDSLSRLTIGCDSDSQIRISSEYVKNDKVILNKKGNEYSLDIINTSYGVYINGKKAKSGDVVQNMDFMSVSDFFFYFKDDSVWTRPHAGMTIEGLIYVDSRLNECYPKFNLNTRLKSTVNNTPIDVLDPPAKPQKPKNDLITKLLPSLAMLMASGAMAYFGGTMIFMSIISGSVAILTSVITVIQNKKDYKQNVAERKQKYEAYIEKKKQEIETKRDDEKKVLDDIYISQEKEINLFNTFSPNLFERTKSDEDYLCVRVGNGSVEAKQEIKFKKQEKLEVGDELQLIPEKLSSEYKYVNSAPIVIDFKKINALGITGDEVFRFSQLKNLVIDISARQYYSDVRMVFVAEPENENKIYWLRMLPYVVSEDNKLRTIVTDNESKNIVFEYLYKELTERKNAKHHDSNIVIFFYDEFGYKNHPLSKFINDGKDLGVTFVFFEENEKDIPTGCDYVIRQDHQKAQLISAENKNHVYSFEYPYISDTDAAKIVQLLAPVYTEEISLEGSLTKNISMFEMLNILAVDDLNLKDRWEKSQVFKSMAAPIGVSKSGMVYLDLHDKYHGPHGLVAGTTGSGKSEVLQTYILSMATLFHPYEVGFVIIDFKGGGMVNQFKNLPHLLGAITNIDGKEIDRSLKSIKAELQKRQRLFAEAEVNHIDKYIKKYKKGEVSVPIPHLILIVDEFAELKADQPEFMKELISAARIGRSLGVHLILATQKPSGQVNEQIWSNSKFKLCLKVQSQEDSNEVLKSPLAAEIKEPGRAYLQVGNNEIFELFQSAYSGAPEKTDDTTVKEFSISSLNSCGKRTLIYSQKRKKSTGNNVTQLDAMVEYVSDYCKTVGIKRLPNICLPPLMDVLNVPKKLPRYSMADLPLGVYDDPDNQYQGYARLNLCEENTMIIGSSQTGKTNLIQVILKMITSKYSPKEAVFYIADFGAMYLKNFEKLSNVGGVVTVSESEKFKNLFKLLVGEIEERKAKFLSCGLSSYLAYCEAGYSDIPQIFFIIDNFSAFKEMYSEQYEDQFMYLTREGISCGISVIITNSATNGLGYRYMSNFANRIALKCNDSNEYMNLFDRCKIQPKDVPGRMICRLNKETFEMQSFLAFEGEKEIDRSNAVKAFVEAINALYPNMAAREIPTVPEKLPFEYIEKNYKIEISSSQRIIGLDYANVSPVVIDLKKWNEFCVIGKDQDKKLAVAKSILTSIHQEVLWKPVRLYMLDSVERKLRSYSELSYVEKYTIDYSEIASLLDQVLVDVEMRYELMMNGDTDSLEHLAYNIFVINNRDVIDFLSSTKGVYEIYNKIVKQYKSLGVAFIYTDVEDTSVSYSGPDLLKRFKESKKAIITSELQEFKFCDLPSSAVRNNKNVNVGDVFLMDGSDISRIKMIEEMEV